MRDLALDLRYALRSLRVHPAFTVTAALTLALGIGVTTSMFGVVDGIVLRPLPFPGADRLISICEQYPGSTPDWCSISPPNVSDIAARSRTIDAIGIARSWGYHLKLSTGTEGIAAGIATPGLFRALSVRPKLGRLFTDADLLGRESDVVVLTNDIWRQRFNADPGVVGRAIVLDGKPVTVIGVLDSGLVVPRLSYVKLWRPLNVLPTDESNREWHGFIAYGRLRPGVALDAARAELTGIANQLRAEHFAKTAGWGLMLTPLEDLVVGKVRPILFTFFGAVFLILFIACANVVNLLLARAAARGREIALRAAVGARPGRIIRGLLVESFVLAVVGAVLGVALAQWGTAAFQKFAPPGIPRVSNVTVDLRVLGFALALAVGTTVLFGLLPAVRSARVDLAQALREGGRSASTRGSRIGRALVVAELALALMLVTGAGLLTRSFAAMAQWRPGFEREHLLTFSLSPSSEKFKTAADLVSIWRRVGEALQPIPGVISVGSTSAGPLFGGGDGADEIRLEGRATPVGATASWFNVSPGYFRTLGVPVLRGRDINERDEAGAPEVALINETMARRYWAGENPIGRRVTMPRSKHTLEVIGVVQDIPPITPGTPPGPEMYFSDRQDPRGFMYFVLRTAVPPASVTATARARLAAVDPDLSPGNVETMPELVDDELTAPRFDMLVLIAFGAAALLLAAVGTYGLFAYVISRRTRELGIRLALGAAPSRVTAEVLRSGLTLAVAGTVVGVLGSVAGARALRSMVSGIAVVDPVTTLVGIAILLLTAALACFGPARRAARVDPLVTLSAE